ncbi:MAG: hypothetical protein ACK5NK_08630 [Niabella sp.]
MLPAVEYMASVLRRTLQLYCNTAHFCTKAQVCNPPRGQAQVKLIVVHKRGK